MSFRSPRIDGLAVSPDAPGGGSNPAASPIELQAANFWGRWATPATLPNAAGNLAGDPAYSCMLPGDLAFVQSTGFIYRLISRGTVGGGDAVWASTTPVTGPSWQWNGTDVSQFDAVGTAWVNGRITSVSLAVAALAGSPNGNELVFGRGRHGHCRYRCCPFVLHTHCRNGRAPVCRVGSGGVGQPALGLGTLRRRGLDRGSFEDHGHSDLRRELESKPLGEVDVGLHDEDIDNAGSPSPLQPLPLRRGKPAPRAANHGARNRSVRLVAQHQVPHSSSHTTSTPLGQHVCSHGDNAIVLASGSEHAHDVACRFAASEYV